MDLPINRNQPQIMHVDLNSCFATVEQQANPLLRGRPIAVAAYLSPGGCVLAPSIEAKNYGVKTGMRVREARLLCPDLMVLPSDPPKYRAVHLRMRRIFTDYTSDVTPKSIDEAVIDFSRARAVNAQRELTDIGAEIKRRLRAEVGDWMSCSIGLGTNRFLAKTAAGLQKPDGLEVINWQNLTKTYDRLELTDLPGINVRYQARLNSGGIFTPLQMSQAPLQLLKKVIFQNINGYYWYLRLRGWEIDAVDFSRRSYGQSYALTVPTADKSELAKLLLKLCEKMGRRLRLAEKTASGLCLSCLYRDRTHWSRSSKTPSRLYDTRSLFLGVIRLLNAQPQSKVITHLGVSCFDLQPSRPEQMELFATTQSKHRQLSVALDQINSRWGEFTITPALMMGMNDTIVDRISFGGISELYEITQ